MKVIKFVNNRVAEPVIQTALLTVIAEDVVYSMEVVVSVRPLHRPTRGDRPVDDRPAPQDSRRAEQ
jgi:hypothetical protein